MSDPEPIKETIGKLQEEITDAGTLERRRKPTIPNPGRPKGKMTPEKITLKRGKEHFNQRVLQNIDTLFNAQLSLAKGEQHLFVKYHTGEGKDRRAHIDIVTDPETIAEYLTDYGETLNHNDDDEYYYISTRPANNQAIDSLLNRALGKAPEKIEIEGGFFKANNLRIEVVQPQNLDIPEAEIIDIDGTDTNTNDDDAPTEHEATLSPDVS